MIRVILLICYFYFFSFCYSQSSNTVKTIVGKVHEVETENPISDCIIFLQDLKNNSSIMTTTDSLGVFHLNNISAKFVKLTAKNISYDGAIMGPFNLSIYDTLKVKFILTPIPFVTESVLVESEKVSRILTENGFYKRKKEGFGKFYSEMDLKKYRVQDSRHLVTLIPQLKINKHGIISPGFQSPGLNGKGEIHIYLDGVKLEQDNGPDEAISLEGIIEIENIAGIEFYPRAVEGPLKYKDFDSNSGILLIWSK